MPAFRTVAPVRLCRRRLRSFSAWQRPRTAAGCPQGKPQARCAALVMPGSRHEIEDTYALP